MSVKIHARFLPDGIRAENTHHALMQNMEREHWPVGIEIDRGEDICVMTGIPTRSTRHYIPRAPHVILTYSTDSDDRFALRGTLLRLLRFLQRDQGSMNWEFRAHETSADGRFSHGCFDYAATYEILAHRHEDWEPHILDSQGRQEDQMIQLMKSHVSDSASPYNEPSWLEERRFEVRYRF